MPDTGVQGGEVNALAYVDRMPAVACHACGWWQYDVPTDTPRGGNRPPVHCPECIEHPGADCQQPDLLGGAL